MVTHRGNSTWSFAGAIRAMFAPRGTSPVRFSAVWQGLHGLLNRGTVPGIHSVSSRGYDRANFTLRRTTNATSSCKSESDKTRRSYRAAVYLVPIPWLISGQISRYRDTTSIQVHYVTSYWPLGSLIRHRVLHVTRRGKSGQFGTNRLPLFFL